MSARSWVLLLVTGLVMATMVSGCDLLFGAEEATMAPSSGGDQFPDVIGVELRPLGDARYDVSVTLSSPYDSPQRYADGWRVTDGAGNTLGVHTLLHDHASEQPFTRTQPGLEIPDGVTEVTVQGRDQANGFGGLPVTVAVPDA